MSIRDNTTSLEEILATVNALPDAGSGGGTITTESLTMGKVTASFAKGMWIFSGFSVQGLVCAIFYNIAEPITELGKTSNPQIIIFVPSTGELKYSYATQHPIVGQYGIVTAGFTAGSSPVGADGIIVSATALSAFTPQFNNWGATLIYNK